MSKLHDKLKAKGYKNPDLLLKDVVDTFREVLMEGESISLLKVGKLTPLVKDKPQHLMKQGVYRKTFKVKFTQSRSLQIDYKAANYGANDLKKKIRTLF